MFKIGDKIKLKNYSTYGDYIEHKGQEATLISRHDPGEWEFGIQWDDGMTSFASVDNIFKINMEWNLQENVVL